MKRLVPAALRESFFLRGFFLMLGVAVAACSSSQPRASNSTNHNGWKNWVRMDEPENQIDSLTHFEESATFTIVPYSELDSNALLGGKDENTALFALASSIMERGYRYTDDIDSADFIVVEKITDDYDSTVPLRNSLKIAPVFQERRPFSLMSNPLGDQASQPQNVLSNSPMTHPVLHIYLYSRSGRLLDRWVCGGVDRNSKILHGSQYLLRRFVQNFPRSMHQDSNVSPGTGRIGLGYMIWSRDGINYWPEITGIVKGTPSDSIELQVTDMILDINGRSVKNVDYDEVLHDLRGDIGDTVQMTILRWDLPLRTYTLRFVAPPKNNTIP